MGKTTFGPAEYGSLLVEVDSSLRKLSVQAVPLTAHGDELYAWPLKQEDGTFLAAFPRMPAGNWSIVTSWMYATDPSKTYEQRKRVTVFPDAVVRLTLSDG